MASSSEGSRPDLSLLEKYLDRSLSKSEQDEWQEIDSKKSFLPPSCQPLYVPTLECQHVIRSLSNDRKMDKEDNKKCLNLNSLFLGCVAEHVESGSYQSDDPQWQRWVQQHNAKKDRVVHLQERQLEMQKNIVELSVEQKEEALKRLGMSDEEAKQMAPKFGRKRTNEEIMKSPIDELRRKYRESVQSGTFATREIFSTSTDSTEAGGKSGAAAKKSWWKLW